MKYFEFGKENPTTLLLLHGVDTTWKMSFQSFINVAQRKYHIIAVAEDGFNPDEPEVEATSVIDGEKEPGFKHVLKKVDSSKYHFAHKVFLNRGHGSLLLEPERLLYEVDLAYKGYKGKIKAR